MTTKTASHAPHHTGVAPRRTAPRYRVAHPAAPGYWLASADPSEAPGADWTADPAEAITWPTEADARRAALAVPGLTRVVIEEGA